MLRENQSRHTSRGNEGAHLNDADATRQLDRIVRAVAAAGKSLRLYPPSSPIPKQAVETTAAALAEYFEQNQVLTLRVARDGFEWYGDAIAPGATGVSDLAEELKEHGIAELDVMPGCSGDDLIAFLTLVGRDMAEVREAGGVGALLVSGGVDTIRVTDIHLTVLEETILEPEGDIEEFLRTLATDPDKLATWMAAASAGDPAAFAEGLEELAAAVGESGVGDLTRSLAAAFMAQQTDGKDALLGLAMEPGTAQMLAGGMFSHLSSEDTATSIAKGLFGENMLSLSSALTHLPLGDSVSQVYQEVQAHLAEFGHTGKEASFLSHMMEVRAKTEPEESLIDADTRYRQVATAADLKPEELDAIRNRATAEVVHTTAAGVRTMLTLLDQQRDFDLYSKTLDNLAAMVPTLIESGDVPLAQQIVNELSVRQSGAGQTWPELPQKLDDALSSALSEPTMHALIDKIVDKPELAQAGRDLVHHANEQALNGMVLQAVAHKEAGIRAVEDLLGRRVLDSLASAAPTAQWYQIGPIVQRLAQENDPRLLEMVKKALARSDEQSRREAAQGVAASGSPAATALLTNMVKDESPEVAIVAIRAIAKNQLPGGAQLLGTRLGELDIDGKDFLVAREIIGALARMPDPAAADALKKLGSRKALIKRGHFAEVQELVRQAIKLRSSKGGTS